MLQLVLAWSYIRLCCAFIAKKQKKKETMPLVKVCVEGMMLLRRLGSRLWGAIALGRVGLVSATVT
jgi:hypothetical protein